MKDKNIGNEIYRLRKEKNLTQNDLAEKMHDHKNNPIPYTVFL